MAADEIGVKDDKIANKNSQRVITAPNIVNDHSNEDDADEYNSDNSDGAGAEKCRGNDRIVYNTNSNNEKEQRWVENTDNYADDGGLKNCNYKRTHHWFISEAGNKERGLLFTK